MITVKARGRVVTTAVTVKLARAAHQRARWRFKASRLCLAALASLGSLGSAQAITSVWTGGSGTGFPYWDLGGNWVASAAPLGIGDSALLGAFSSTIRNGTWDLFSVQGTGDLLMTAGSLSVSASSSIGNLTLSNGAIGGAGTLSSTGFVWQTNSQLGVGTSPSGSLVVSGATTFGATGNGNTLAFGQSLVLDGNSSWNGGPNGNTLFIGGGGTTPGGTAYGASTVRLNAGRTLAVQSGTIDGGGNFVNRGTVVTSGGGLAIRTAFDNSDGTVRANNGSIAWTGTRTIGGTLQVGSGMSMAFGNAVTLDPLVAITNAGSLILGGSNGSTVVQSGTVGVAGNGSNTLVVGGALGGAGQLVLNNLSWQTNSQLGVGTSPSGSVVVNGATTFGTTGNGNTLAFGESLVLNGDSSWNGGPNGNTLFIGGGGTTTGGTAYGASTVTLNAGRTLAVQSGTIDGGGNFVNRGTVVTSGGGLAIRTAFDNSGGTVRADNGSIAWTGTRTIGGTLQVGSGMSMTFGNTVTLDPLVAITNAGSLILGGNNGTTSVQSGTVSVAGNGSNTLVVGGTLGGAGQLVLNNLSWQTNSQLGVGTSPSGTVVVNGATTFGSTGNGNTLAFGESLVLNGDSSWNAGPNGNTLFIGGAGTTPGGTVYGPSTVTLNAGRTLAVQNGTIGGGGNFVNRGTVAVTQAGTGMAIAAGTNFQNIGTIVTGASSVVQLPSGFNNPGTLKGNGTFNAVNLVNAGHIAPGQSLGTLTINGSLIQTASGVMDLEVERGDSSGHDLLAVTGAVALAGTLDVVCFGNCAMAAGTSFKILDAAANALTGSFASVVLTGFAAGDFSVRYDLALGDVWLNVVADTLPAAVPEPGTAALWLAGAAFLGSLARRRRQDDSMAQDFPERDG